MNAEVERVPPEGPTYRMRLDAAVAAVAQLIDAGASSDAVVVCARPGHRAAQPVVAHLWEYGNEVLWRAEHRSDELGTPMSAILDRWRNVGIDWKASGANLGALQLRYVNAHLLNVPPADRVDSTEHEGITADAEGNTAPGWHTSEWPGGPEVLANCPEHGQLVPDEMAMLAAVARGDRRVLLT